MKNKSKIAVFLYTEISDYFISACALLSNQIDVSIIHWPIAKEAPFDFSEYSGLNLINREGLKLSEIEKMVVQLNPDVLICSGWIDKDYIKVVKNYSGKIPTVLTLDNHWRGTWKQQLAKVVSRFTIRKTFSHVWVPGEMQTIYACHLGFQKQKISSGFYTANLRLFQSYYTSRNKNSNVARRFLFVGRYVRHKGIYDLWEAFTKYRKQGGVWELICIGTGDQWENRIKEDGITHLGFIQPNELREYLKEGGVYILPSHFEPWGVSVHEMAASGYPMILSDRVGAKETFLEEGINGFSFTSGSVLDLLNSMKKISDLDQQELQMMSNKSFEFSNRITPEKWVQTVLKFLR